MFRFETLAARGVLPAAIAMAASLSFSAPAGAAEVYISAQTPSSSGPLTYLANFSTAQDPIGFNTDALPSIYSMNAGTSLDAEHISDLLAFCIDPFHPFAVDSPKDANGDYILDVNGFQLPAVISAPVYGDLMGPLTNFSSNVPVSDDDRDRVGQLINFGQSLFDLNSNSAFELAAIQGAIWKIFNPTYTVSGKVFDVGAMGYNASLGADLSTRINLYATGAVDLGNTSKSFRALVARDHNVVSQALGLAETAVVSIPEPSAWIMMLSGFFGLGSALRFNRRRQTA